MNIKRILQNPQYHFLACVIVAIILMIVITKAF